MAMQFREVLFQTLIVWSSEVEIYKTRFIVSGTREIEKQARTIQGIS